MEDTVRLPLSLKGVHSGESPGWHLAVVRICEALLGMSKQCARDSGCCSEGMFAPCLSCVSCMEGNISTTTIRNQRSPTVSLDNLRLLYELLFSTHNRKKEWVIVAHGRRVPWTHDKTHWPDAWSEGKAAGCEAADHTGSSQETERWMLVLTLPSPFDSVQNSSPWDSALCIQNRSSQLNL